MLEEDAQVTRFEVIEVNHGRVYVRYNVEIVRSYQDDNRTLKVFVKYRKVPSALRRWFDSLLARPVP